MNKFIAVYKPKENRPGEPILVGRDQSQARISIIEAEELVEQLEHAIRCAKMDAPPWIEIRKPA